MVADFEWDETKNKQNQQKHRISFEEAQNVFRDNNRIIIENVKHSTIQETRYICIGKIGDRICTVRFTYRNKRIRIIGAGYWRKERKKYEQTKK